MSERLLPPQTEVDEDGRHVHPYVRERTVDPSAGGFETNGGQQVTPEDRSRESRLVYHALEPLLGHLTPLALAYVMQSCIHRLYSPALADEMAEMGVTAQQLDPYDELLRFEQAHSERLRLIGEHLDEIVSRCPRCGRKHADERFPPVPQPSEETAR